MAEIRCDKCGALQKNKDVNKGICWKCNESIILEPKNTQSIEDNTSPAKEKIYSPLSVTKILRGSFKIGFDNIGTILGASLLWILTIWIPYLNVGTTIAMIGLIVTISKNEPFNPTDIFQEKYRKNMGEFFLLISFLVTGITSGMFFIIIPGIVIGIAWSMSIFLLVDKELAPLQAIKFSNQMTYGVKFNIFLAKMSLVILYFLSILILSWLSWESSFFLILLFFICVLVPATIGLSAYLYRELTTRVEQSNT